MKIKSQDFAQCVMIVQINMSDIINIKPSIMIQNLIMLAIPSVVLFLLFVPSVLKRNEIFIYYFGF
jgi:hypothetical protein